MPKIFSSFLFGFNVISKKKKGLRLSSASFLRNLCDIPEQSAVTRSCLRFLERNKNASFWREKKRRNSQNFSAKMPEKISHFFALIGNTGLYLTVAEKLQSGSKTGYIVIINHYQFLMHLAACAIHINSQLSFSTIV